MREKIVKYGVMAFLVLGVFIVTFSQYSKQVEANGDIEFTHMTPTTNENIFFDESKEMYFDVREDGYIDEVYEVKGGQVVGTISVEDYVETPEIQTFEQPNLLSSRAGSVYSYTEKSNELIRQFGTKASITQENPGPGSDTQSIAYTATNSHAFTISVDAEIIKVIKAGVSYTYNTTASITSSHSMTIEPGYAGYWRFDPSVRRSMGTLKNLTNKTEESIRAYYPVKLNNQLDGFLVAVKTPLKAGN